MIGHQRVFITVAFILLCFGSAIAQCPMCKMAAESNLENGGSAGAGLNTGILYMLSMPYILVGVLGYIWYKNKKSHDLPQEDSILVPPVQ